MSLEIAVVFAIKVARGAALTGLAASLVVLMFSASHAADRDPWRFPSVIMSILTWLVNLALVTWHRGRSYDSPQPSLFQPLDGIRTAAKEAIGVILALVILFTLNAPLIWWGYESAIYAARKNAQGKPTIISTNNDRWIERRKHSTEMQREASRANQTPVSP
ncbi:hypothetical protein ACYOEI_14680 [Singulisphaera rosea]